MFKKIIFVILLTVCYNSAFATAGLTIQSIFYCGDDFSMLMSNGERWVVKKSQVGEQKLNHFISIALYMAATGKKTGNVFPGQPESWCGNPNAKPITIISTQN